WSLVTVVGVALTCFVLWYAVLLSGRLCLHVVNVRFWWLVWLCLLCWVWCLGFGWVWCWWVLVGWCVGGLVFGCVVGGWLCGFGFVVVLVVCC
ncbi:hypothetical protein, partial [Pseudomonas syringae group genomosp. 7]|uniref:hypothetical protein n=1 Tax=Pseudomonas syringae group genomosp. 7 TaxID=251699 RepID=UPI00376FBFC4